MRRALIPGEGICPHWPEAAGTMTRRRWPGVLMTCLSPYEGDPPQRCQEKAPAGQHGLDGAAIAVSAGIGFLTGGPAAAALGAVPGAAGWLFKVCLRPNLSGSDAVLGA